jgi:GNAT superfamily N-acetyltransferase
MATSGTVYVYSPADHSHLTPYLAALHAACITHDRTIATFLPPLSQDKLLNYWKQCIAEINAGTRLLLLLADESEQGAKLKGSELMGCVMLSYPFTETGKMRGFVEKLLVSPKFRNRGGARRLIQVLEAEGTRRGKTLFVSHASIPS